MAVTRDIAATYRGPGKVLQRLLERGARETYALTIVMAACLVVFVAQWPKISRDAHMNGEEIYLPVYGALIGVVFALPILMYVVAAISQGLVRLLGGKGYGYGARLSLFWAFLAASPVLLLLGLVEGFIGAGQQVFVVKILWVGVFLWFWLSGLRVSQWGK